MAISFFSRHFIKLLPNFVAKSFNRRQSSLEHSLFVATSFPNAENWQDRHQDLKKDWLQQILTGKPIEVDPKNLYHKISVTFLIADILKLPQESRQILLINGGLKKYFDYVENLSKKAIGCFPPMTIPNFFYRLSLLDELERGKVLNNVEPWYLCEFASAVFDTIDTTPCATFVKGCFLTVHGLRHFLKTAQDNCQLNADILINEGILRRQLSSVYDKITRIFFDQWKSGQIYVLPEEMLNLMSFLSSYWKISLCNHRNAEKFAKFSISCFKQCWKSPEDINGHLKISCAISLLNFYRTFRSIDFDPNFCQSINFQNLNNHWLDFWLEKSMESFAQLNNPSHVIEAMVDYFLEISLRFKTFKTFQQNDQKILRILEKISDAKKVDILENLEQFRNDAEGPAKILLEQCSVTLNAITF